MSGGATMEDGTMTSLRHIVLDGQTLDYATLAALAAGARITLSPQGLERAGASARDLALAIARGTMVYGTTTGVGAMKDTIWDAAAQVCFAAGMPLAHSIGIGPALPTQQVRLAMALRINTALSGTVGCSPQLLQAMAAMLNADIVPLVRGYGSVGCADIGLMGQIAAAMSGSGEVSCGGEIRPAAEALAMAGLQPFPLVARDALAVISVNCVAIAGAVLALRETAQVLRQMMVGALLSSAVTGTSLTPWRAAVEVGSPYEAETGRWFLQAAGEGWTISKRIHDPLSLRMTAQIFGAVLEATMRAGSDVLAAATRSDDNPVIVENEVLTSGASLPLGIALSLQSLQLALAHLSRNVVNRAILTVNGAMGALPVNLVAPGAVATGFGPALKLTGEQGARVMALSYPVSAQNLVLAGGMEDEATFLPLIVERLHQQLDALRILAATEAMFATQAGDLAATTLPPLAAALHREVRGIAPMLQQDRFLTHEIERVQHWIFSDDIAAGMRALAPCEILDTQFALNFATAQMETPE